MISEATEIRIIRTISEGGLVAQDKRRNNGLWAVYPPMLTGFNEIHF